jgi:hypothetical protein
MVSLLLPDLRAERSRNGDPTPLPRGLALGVAPAPVLEPVFVELDVELRRPLLQALLNLVHGPQTVVDRIVPELQRIGRKPEVISRVKSIGGQVVCSTPGGAGRACARRHRQVAGSGAPRGHPGGMSGRR